MRKLKIALLALSVLIVAPEPTSCFSMPYVSDYQEPDNLGSYEVLAQLVQAEAGNQGMLGKRLVVDVVLNRIDSDRFPNSLEEVIFQDGQFTCIKNGAFDKAGWDVSPECYEAVKMELHHRTNSKYLFFSRGKSPYVDNHVKVEDHWFSY